MAKQLATAQNFQEKVNKVFTETGTPAYLADPVLKQLQTIVGTLARRIESVMQSADKDSFAEREEVDKSLALIIESYNLFVLRKNLLDGKNSAPVEVRDLNDVTKLNNTFDGHLDTPILSFGLKPGDKGPDNADFNWENGLGLKVKVLGGGTRHNYLKNALTAEKVPHLPASTVALCRKRTPNVYLTYLVLTGQIPLDEENSEMMRTACANIDDHKALAKMVENGNTAGIIEYFTKKKIR